MGSKTGLEGRGGINTGLPVGCGRSGTQDGPQHSALSILAAPHEYFVAVFVAVDVSVEVVDAVDVKIPERTVALAVAVV